MPVMSEIRLTDRAAERVREFMARDGGLGLRLGVRRTGCSGWAYEVELAHEVAADDHVFEHRGIKVVVPGGVLEKVAGTEIDFVAEGLNQTFQFKNPNVTGECGCGESFAV